MSLPLLVRSLVVTLVLLLSCSLSHAAEPITALVYSIGYKLDKSFNESAFRAVMKLREGGCEVMEFLPRNTEESRTMLEKAASVAEHVVVIGFTHTENLKAIAPLYPNTRFTMVDSVVKAPNVQSLTFREEEGAFLAGVAAASSSHHNTIGFVGGMDTPTIHRFQAGYEQGAYYVSPKVKIINRYIGDNIHAFSDPMGGYLVAMHEIRQGADVLFAAAGSSGLGVYQAADETINFAIGVDSDQNHLFPTTMLTSLVKDIGKAIIDTIESCNTGTWEPKVRSFGLKEGAFYLTVNKYNRLHFPKPVLDAVHSAKEEIIAGRITISTIPSPLAPVGVPYLD